MKIKTVATKELNLTNSKEPVQESKDKSLATLHLAHSRKLAGGGVGEISGH